MNKSKKAVSPRIRTWLNYKELYFEGEVNSLPSETMPDQVMSIKDMLARHLRGLPVNGASSPGTYYPEELGYVPHPDELDLVDRKEYAKIFEGYALDLNERLQALSSPKQPEPAAPQSAEGDRPPVSGGETPTSTQTPPAAPSA